MNLNIPEVGGFTIAIILLFFFFKDRWFSHKNKENEELIKITLKNAYDEIIEEIPYIEKIAKNIYSDSELTHKYISQFPYDDILKTAKLLLKINKYKKINKMIIKTIEHKREENIRKNAKTLYMLCTKLYKKLEKYSPPF